jgi:hypothetical protein
LELKEDWDEEMRAFLKQIENIEEVSNKVTPNITQTWIKGLQRTLLQGGKAKLSRSA